MKNVRVSRFADDPPLPGPDTPEDRVAVLPLDDETTELTIFFFFEDDRRRARVRKFSVLPDGELEVISDRLATSAEVEASDERFRQLDEDTRKRWLAKGLEARRN